MADKADIVEDIGGGLSFSAAPPEMDPNNKVEPYVRPENVPAKFWNSDKGTVNTEALLKSYGELEKRFSAPGEEGAAVEEKPAEVVEEAPEAKPEEGAEEKPEDKPEEKPEEKAAEADLTAAMETAQKVYAETGTLDADTRAPFLATGISNEQIDLYLQGVKAHEAGLKDAAVKAAGVSDYSEIEAAIAWAKDNWSEKKILAFNAQGTDVETIGGAVKVLFNDFRDANPGEGALLNIGGGTNRGDVFASNDEYSVALTKADALPDLAERRVARAEAVAKMRRSITAKSIK